ncbi:MAG: glycosyl hydrolase, partial [Adhaeribacter sp.]|nr:glycosyl hydrolase [Adhaeribacter sp.]
MVVLLTACAGSKSSKNNEEGWVRIFDGRSLQGWLASERPETFKVENGAIVVNGERAHLFYVGPFKDHNFKNFEFKADVMTTPGSNSGMYIHTEFQKTGWPNRGYEIQVNNSHSDWRRTGSVYAIEDVREQLAKDNEWYTQHIIVKEKKITVKVNDKIAAEYTEPENVSRPNDMAGRKLSSGTVALQGH